MIKILGILDFEPFNSFYQLLILWSIHFLMADAPVDTVEAAEEAQQGNKFIVNDRLITRCKGKMKDYERV